MSNRKNPHYEHAAARHRATGKEQKFEGQWQLLHAIMLRNDLSLAAYRVAYLLYAIRLNSKSSLCFTTDSRMAADLGLNIRTIERAKKQLKDHGLLSWTTNRSAGQNDVCIYDLNPAVTNTGNPVATNTGNPVADATSLSPGIPAILTTELPVVLTKISSTKPSAGILVAYSDHWHAELNRKIAAGEPVDFMIKQAKAGHGYTVTRETP